MVDCAGAGCWDSPEGAGEPRSERHSLPSASGSEMAFLESSSRTSGMLPEEAARGSEEVLARSVQHTKP